MAKTKRVVKLWEIMKISELLEAHLVKTNELTSDGRIIWKYAEDWTDEKVAKTVSPELTDSHVMRIRVELYGIVQRPKGEGKQHETKVRHDRVGTLETRLANVERLVRYLCQQLDVPCDPNTGT